MENRAQQRELKALKEKKAMETGEIEADENEKMLEEDDRIIEALEEEVSKYRSKVGDMEAKLKEMEERAKSAEKQVQQLMAKLHMEQWKPFQEQAIENSELKSIDHTKEDLSTENTFNEFKRKQSNVVSAREQVVFNNAIEEFVKHDLEICEKEVFISTRDLLDAFSAKSGFADVSDIVFARALKTHINQILGSVMYGRNGSTRGYNGLKLKIE